MCFMGDRGHTSYMAIDDFLIPLHTLSAESRAVLDALAAREGLDATDYAIQRATTDGRLITYSDDEGEVFLED
jgi:hypothetical protein